eukprot:gene5166-5685_t
MASIFHGNDLTQWLHYFRLQYCGLEAVLQELEVNDMSDLRLVVEDENLVAVVCQQIGTIGSMKFRRALALTSFTFTRGDIEGNNTQETTQYSTFLLEANESLDALTAPHRKERESRLDLSREYFNKNENSFVLAIQYCVVPFVGVIRQLHPLLKLRIAFVGYRDFFGDEDQAMGGGDEAEDVLGGLKTVDNLDWQLENRIMLEMLRAMGQSSMIRKSQTTGQDGVACYRHVFRSFYDKKMLW